MTRLTRNNGPARTARAVPVAVAMSLGAVLLAGCQTTATTEADIAQHHYAKRHPIVLSEEPETLDLAIGMKARSLSPEIDTAIANFADDYHRSGTGAVTIQVPSGSANEIAAVSAGRAAARALVKAGVSKRMIRMVPYSVQNPTKIAAVRLSFLKVKAVTPQCGLWPEDSTATKKNGNNFNFGCATQQNLAAMVANPADFAAPESMTPANGARRAKVLSDYAKGEDTQSKMKLLTTSSGG